MQYKAIADATQALDQKFTTYGEVLERVDVFQFLGQLLGYNNNDAQAMHTNLKKARKYWRRVLHMPMAENASSRIWVMFYKATVQAILLFGSETWVFSILSGT